MPEAQEKIFNIPNALSAYRIVALPFIIYSIAGSDKHLFIILVSVNLITDILDGLIARMFNLKTAFGARLDSIADIGTFMMAICGFFFLERAFVHEHKQAFLALFILYAAAYLISIFKFKRIQSLHLYSMKVTGYLQGLFIFTFFNFGYAPWFFYLMLTASFIAYTEEIAALLVMKGLISDIKSIFLLKKVNP